MITSTSNPLVKRLRKLRYRRFRQTEGVFLVEGIAHVRQAIDHNARFERIFVSPELLTSEGAWSAIETSRTAGIEVTELGREAFESIVERDHPSGLGAVVVMNEVPLTSLVAEPDGVFVGLVDVGNPGNLGSIVRTVDAVGGHGVIVVGESTDQFHPAAVKASMGTIFTVPIARAAHMDDLWAWAMMEDIEVVTTSVRGKEVIWEARLPEPALYLFGSEALGLPQEVIDRSDLSVSMPMAGAASSLNLAVAAGVMLYEVRRRRSPR
ncbi:MAG: TrmH family RNA methyltransferase [Actinomycetota bacterium]